MKVFLRILATVLVLAIGGYFVAELVATQKFKQSLDEELVKLEKYAKIDYEHFRFRLLQRDYVLGDVTVRPKDSKSLILVDHVKATCQDFDINLKTVKDLQINVDGIRFHEFVEGQEGETSPVLNGLGYEDPKFNLNLDYGYDPATRVVNVRHLNLGNDEIGKVEFQLQLSGIQSIDSNSLTAKDVIPQLTGLLSAMTFNSGELYYDDEGFAPRLIESHAELAGMTREEYVEMLVGRLKMLKLLKLSDQVILALENFLKEPDTIRIVAKPPVPVNSMILMGGVMVGMSPMDIFGIRVVN